MNSQAQIDALLLRRDQEAKAVSREMAQELIERLNTLCDDFDDGDCVDLDEFLDLRNGRMTPWNHTIPEAGRFFMGLNFTAQQMTAVEEAVLSVRMPPGTLDTEAEALAGICREWLAGRKKGAA